MDASGASSNGSSLMRASRNDETVKVIVRCRPLSQQEIGQGHDRIVRMHTDRGLVELRNPKGTTDEPSKDFTFDAIYDENSRQSDLYEETFRELVDSVLSGFNGTIFAYGQTGTGKTYTMEGIADVPDERGVLHNTFEHIFSHIAASRNQQYLVRASYLEIYQEELRDLLVDDVKQKLELKERPDTGIYVPNLKSTVCKSIVEIRRLMAEGNRNRMTAFTNMNERSSRSHAIFIITIECSEVGADGENHIRVGRLNLVDLAGSERQAKTGATGDRLKEATKINLSLSALGNVISALVDGRSTHIPYRDSKLTRLLQDSLGGNSKTVMVACIGPASYNFEETLSTLRYANRAKNIKNRPKINEDPKDALLREFQEEINRLKAMLETKKKGGRPMTASGRASSAASSSTGGDDEWDSAQRRMEREREAIENDANLIESEKSRLLVELQSRADALEQERRAQQAVAERLRKIQESMLGGDEEALLGRTRAQNEELEQRRKMIAEQKKREREMQEQLEQREESMNEFHSTVTNLKTELEGRQRRLKKMYIKLQKARMGLEDARISSSSERQETETSVTELTKELKLKLLIVENFIPLEVRERVESSVSWDDDNQLWTRPSTSTAGDDSGVGSTEEVRYCESAPIPEEVYEARPIATPGARRPMSRVERSRIEHARDRLTRRGAASRPSLFDPSPPHVEASMPEEFARFCGENILVFNTVERAPRRVRDINEAISQSKSASDRPMSSSTVTLDLGGTLMTSSSTASTRPPSRSHLRTPSAGRSRSKNSSARNALSSAPAPSDRMGGPIKVTPLGPARPTPASVVVYPTARGLQDSYYSSTVTQSDLLGIPVFSTSSTPSTSSSDEASEGICADYAGSSSQGDEKESLADDDEEDTIYETLKWRGRVSAAAGTTPLPLEAVVITPRRCGPSVLPWRASSAPRHLSPSPAPPLARPHLHRSSMTSASPLSSSGVFSASSSTSSLQSMSRRGGETVWSASRSLYLGALSAPRPSLLMSSSMSSSPRRTTPSRIPRPSAPHRQMSASYGGRSASVEASLVPRDGSRECLASFEDDDEEGICGRRRRLSALSSVRQASLEVLARATQRTPRGLREADDRCDATPRLRSLPPPSLTERRILTRRTQQPPPGYTADAPIAALARSMRESFLARVRTPTPEPEPEPKKRKRKETRAEHQLSLYRLTAAACRDCRHEARLARRVVIGVRGTHRQSHTGRVHKPLVVRRSRCICERITVPIDSRPPTVYPMPDPVYCYNLAIFFAALAFLFRCLITVVELSY